MELRINNKRLEECSEEDFIALLHNEDYRESQYLDYKQEISFMMVSKELVAAKSAEFRSDICSFANTEGGYIIFGIKEREGLAIDLTGIDIINPDKAELDLRNKLAPIQPKTPLVKFSFVRLANGRFLVIIRIDRDNYAPYIHTEEEKNYRIYKREGNKKAVIGYTELRNLFFQSRVLDNEIYDFRKKRIQFYQEVDDQEHKQFLLFHFIPESFLTETKQLFLIERETHQSFRAVFSCTGIESLSIPNVDGLRYVSRQSAEEGVVFDSGVVEYFLPLSAPNERFVYKRQDGTFFASDSVWGYIDHVTQGYQEMMPGLYGKQRYFGCISVIGCKGVITSEDEYHIYYNKLDRDILLCHPIVFTDMDNKDTFYRELKQLHLEFLLSIGRKDRAVEDLIKVIESME